MKRPRPQYVAAAAIGVVGLLVAAAIAVAGVLAGGNIPTGPTSYEIRPVWNRLAAASAIGVQRTERVGGRAGRRPDRDQQLEYLTYHLPLPLPSL
ncbi:hypothetical protein [Actinomadura sp. GTD37]|uniref:hypothetical protein n=1 Tax=Actinomadura sp. GTD37 TaxID=1778030 RepID=UPI0035C0229E